MNEFLTAYKDKFYRYALRLTNNEYDAEDIMQELAIKIWEYGEKFSEIDNQDAWCMAVTRNMAIDKLRQNKKYGMEGIDPVLYKAQDHAPTPDKDLETSDLLEKLKKLINSLPENYRTVIHLREIEQMSYKEIAEIMQTDLQNVKAFIFRGRKLFQQLIIESKLKRN
jgi:RNA polymerase sigma-70 factor (ECF subfamily)